MAKTTKKKTQTKKKIAKTEEIAKRAPPIQEGLVSIAMLPSDLTTLTNLMSICAKIFEEQALLAMHQGDENRFTILSARHKLSSMFADKFVEFSKMPEPESRDVH
jgi:hypothetical protein